MSASHSDFPKPPIHLGFGKVLEAHLSYRLLSHYLPLGKIGGKPSWLNPLNLPSSNSLLCRVCGKPMAFLIQVYTTNYSDQEYAFHRTLFFFICRNAQCSRSNDASNIRAFRCSLPRANDFYSFESAPDPDLAGDIPDPFWKPFYPQLCHLCGCPATKKCARCESAWYCCREHQAIDWSSSHKKECSKQSSSASEQSSAAHSSVKENSDNSWVRPERSVAANPFVFPEYAVEMLTDYISRRCYNDSDCDGDEGENDSDNNAAMEKRMEDYKQYVKNNKEMYGLNCEMEEMEDSTDVAFKRFKKVVGLNSDQVLRYDHGGTPLLATDHAPIPQLIPPCSLCGSERQFELQLMPHLLSLIGVDSLGASIDWATLLLYTCAKNCHIPDDGYAEEFIHKQDFY